MSANIFTRASWRLQPRAARIEEEEGSGCDAAKASVPRAMIASSEEYTDRLLLAACCLSQNGYGAAAAAAA